jgi:hypothetical protein
MKHRILLFLEPQKIAHQLPSYLRYDQDYPLSFDAQVPFPPVASCLNLLSSSVTT